MEPKIIYEDKNLFVMFKPAKYPVQSDKTNDLDLKTYLVQHMQSQKGFQDPYVGVVHRLDRPVSGLVCFAKNPRTNKVLSAQLQDRSFKKTYLAVVEGKPENMTLEDHLKKRSKDNTSIVVAPGTPGAKQAILHLKTKATITQDKEEWSLVEIELETGRHHQIRVQLAHAGYPIWGDTKYSPTFQNKRGWFQIALFASSLTFRDPEGKQQSFELNPTEEPFSWFN